MVDCPPRETIKGELDLVREETYQLLSQMDQVTTVHLKTDSLPQSLLLALASLPQLSSLFFHSLPTFVSKRLVFPPFGHLQQLAHVSPRLGDPIQWEEERFGKMIRKFLFETACTSASALVCLEIFGQFVQFERMASLQWSSLQTLILRGHLYAKDAKLFSTVLAVTPQLSKLVMHLFVVGDSTPQFSVYPHDSDIPLHSVPKLQITESHISQSSSIGSHISTSHG